MKMANVFDVAKYILEKHLTLSAMKLQKLVYYSQAWHSVWSDQPLFDNRIEAWANGPVCPNLYTYHRGQFQIDVQSFPWGNSDVLTADQKDSINEVLNVYGDKSSQWLSDLTHIEKPWMDARKDYAPGQICNEEITLASMVEYYSSLK
jgi:uncharacterized phage-associated protein